MAEGEAVGALSAEAEVASEAARKRRRCMLADCIGVSEVTPGTHPSRRWEEPVHFGGPLFFWSRAAGLQPLPVAQFLVRGGVGQQRDRFGLALQFVRTTALGVGAVAGEGRYFSGVFTVGRAVLFPVCADAGAR